MTHTNLLLSATAFLCAAFLAFDGARSIRNGEFRFGLTAMSLGGPVERRTRPFFFWLLVGSYGLAGVTSFLLAIVFLFLRISN
jgi:hypothetical protein